jgi:hypothetical protein
LTEQKKISDEENLSTIEFLPPQLTPVGLRSFPAGRNPFSHSMFSLCFDFGQL